MTFDLEKAKKRPQIIIGQLAHDKFVHESYWKEAIEEIERLQNDLQFLIKEERESAIKIVEQHKEIMLLREALIDERKTITSFIKAAAISSLQDEGLL